MIVVKYSRYIKLLNIIFITVFKILLVCKDLCCVLNCWTRGKNFIFINLTAKSKFSIKIEINYSCYNITTSNITYMDKKKKLNYKGFQVL